MARDYYLILGINADATPDQIKTAYRNKAKSVHPDHAGGSCEPFRDVQQAYEVLSDPARRKTYDDQLAHERRSRRRARDLEPEPLIPTDPRATRRTGRDAFHSPPSSSLFQALYDHLWDEPDPWAFPRPGEDQDLHVETDLTWEQARRGGDQDLPVEVDLTWEQARRGGDVQVWLPVQRLCPTCQGRGENRLFLCPYCRGSGMIAQEVPLSISYPAGVPDGTTARLSLDRFGIHHASLLVHIRVRW